MNTRKLTTAALAAIAGTSIAGAASAQDFYTYRTSSFSAWSENYSLVAITHQFTAEAGGLSTSRTRAEVQAEVVAQRGEIGALIGEAGGPRQDVPKSVGTKTRAEVTAELLAHREEVQAITGEDGGAVYYATQRRGEAQLRLPANANPALSREQVRADAAAALRSGELGDFRYGVLGTK